ncbi:hypothetical protein [Saccharothrix sp. HUAS TT1]|uniref:hypothetical protein n=1 Tax=unclassified Saccharothrix TaxID=2593673 RepID=UPI00345C500A
MSAEGSASAVGGTNWDAYSHEELYRMLWEDADVADVSVVATEWARHRVALDAHAEVLREQRAALLDGWSGPAAEEAADRLDALAARVEKISELARAGQVAAQEAADALATARATMPPPPADPAVPFGNGQPTSVQSAFGAGLPPLPPLPPLPAFPSAPTFPMASFAPASNFSGMFAPTTTTSGTSAAFGVVGGAGFSFYFGAASADQQKAEAVRAMRAYESSLAGSGRLIDQARGAIPPAAPVSRANVPAAVPGTPNRTAGGSVTGSRGGVPWARLLGGGGSAVGPTPVGAGAQAGHAAQLAPGMRAGVLLGAAGPFGTSFGPGAADPAATRGAGQAAVAPPVGGRPGGGDDEQHENRMPTVDHGLFTVDDPVSPAVIGETTGARP